MKKEKRYYQIRIDYFWLSILAVIIVISIIIAYYASAHEQTSSQPVSTKWNTLIYKLRQYRQNMFCVSYFNYILNLFQSSQFIFLQKFSCFDTQQTLGIFFKFFDCSLSTNDLLCRFFDFINLIIYIKE